jgi:hypothetical protein
VRWLAVALVLLAAAGAATVARANGDPASDVLPFRPVFLSTQEPTSSDAGEDLLFLAGEAKKKKFEIRVAVIARQSDLGLVQSLWRKPQAYANFLGRELITFSRYHGTLLVSMPNGFGVFGPGARPRATQALAALAKPGTGDVERLGSDTAAAMRRVAAANGHPLQAERPSSGTPAWVFVLVGVAGAALIAAVVFFGLRRWLTRP